MPNMRDVAREAHAARNRCKQRGTATAFYKSDDGKGRQGWQVCLLHYENFDKHYGEIGNYEERWGNSEIFLGTDGMLYVYHFRGQEIGTGRGGTGQPEMSYRVVKATVEDLKKPLLVLKTTRPYFVAVMEGLRALSR